MSAVRFCPKAPYYAGVAQLVEQLTCNQQVEGSIPFASSIYECGCSSMVELQPSKLITWVRFPSPAPLFSWLCRGGGTGRRTGLKIRRLETTVPVRFRSSAPPIVSIPLIFILRGRGGMADALASGASDGNIMEVQVLSTAPFTLRPARSFFCI